MIRLLCVTSVTLLTAAVGEGNPHRIGGNTLLQVGSAGEIDSLGFNSRSEFVPTQGSGGTLLATAEGLCAEDRYDPSELEKRFITHSKDWPNDRKALCENLAEGSMWISENLHGETRTGKNIFSRLCKKGAAPQLLEPLAGVLRDPNFICGGTGWEQEFSINWLVVADHHGVHPSGKKIMFDAGGTRFMDAMHFFTSQYEKRGISFDKIYVWEARHQGTDQYWMGTPSAIRQKWESLLTFYDGVPCSKDIHDTQNNPFARLRSECKPEDFCVFKLDIDTPSVELPIVQQLLASPETGQILDEFFFEHHVHGLMQKYGWGDGVDGTYADSYEIFTNLRKMGVRAHSWI
jgi:hypothetical protein